MTATAPPQQASDDPAVRVTGLTITTTAGDPIVDDISFSVQPGEFLAVIGESGSGKTTTAFALLGWANPGTSIAGGQVLIGDQPMLGRPEAETRRLRSRLVGYVPQDPTQALNPAQRVGRQLAEIAHLHGGDRDSSIARVLDQVGLPHDRRFRRRYPHQLSGGQRQRVTIAQALLGRPALLVLDEPTTGLDAVTRREFLTTLDRLRGDTGVAMVYVTHDVAAVAAVADRVAVLYAGRLVEHGPARAVLGRPRHPYTRGLLDAVLDPHTATAVTGIPGGIPAVGSRPPGCVFAPRCSQARPECGSRPPELHTIGPDHHLRCHHPVAGRPEPRPRSRRADPQRPARPVLRVRGLRAGHRTPTGDIVVADDVDLDLDAGSCLALVGESGAGKTTIGRCIAGLHRPDAGALALDGAALAGAARRRTPDQRRRIQMIYQSPGESLNPRRTIGAEIERVLRYFGTVEARPVVNLLDRVRLPASLASRYPGELSGGEQQRAAIARALAADPSILICDEITSALDVSVQAAVLDLLAELRHHDNLAVLFITHDLGVVTAIADQIAILDQARVQACGPTNEVLHAGHNPYTRHLLAAARSVLAPLRE